MTGRKLSHYDLIEEISRGGMGIVYRAVDVNLGREVALKVLPDDLVHDPVRRERLLQEARAASALEHPNIAVIHEVGEADGITFIAMELIRGEKLSDTLSRGPLSQTRTFALATEIAEGLARAHDKGIVHRDLKPANVMVTDDGHVKIIDFGLAKLIERVSAEQATASIQAQRTDAGVVLGTAAYMSPEQARGDRVDHRSDVFALGVTLYEMLTGRPAFQGRSSLDTMQAVLTQPVPPLPAIAGSSAEVTAELQRIITKCTAKEPDDRFQGMKDLVVDLRAARRRLESSQTAAAVPVSGLQVPAPLQPGRSRTKFIAPLLLAVVIAGAAVWWWAGGRQQPAVTRSGKPAIAVMYFDNNTGDASLDWMRTGLTDMMVTDLSQSTEIEVLGTDRLVQILQDLRRADDRVISADVVREIASRAAVDTVLVGSYVRAGGTIRISARLQEARTGRIVSAERVEGAAESSLFALVDELTSRFKSKMVGLGGPKPGALLPRPGEAAEAGDDRGLTEVTTSSIEAYRYYAEGMNYHERGLSSEAAPLLEKAIEIDPSFAMAFAKLAVVNNNLALFDKRDEYAKRALERTDRLTSRERYYIEGFYYGLRPETLERSLAAYKQGLALHPEHQASRHNLGLHFIMLERFPGRHPAVRGARPPRNVEPDGVRKPVGGAARQREHPSRPRSVGEVRGAIPGKCRWPAHDGEHTHRGRPPRRRACSPGEVSGVGSTRFRDPAGKASRRDTATPLGRCGGGERGVRQSARAIQSISQPHRRRASSRRSTDEARPCSTSGIAQRACLDFRRRNEPRPGFGFPGCCSGRGSHPLPWRRRSSRWSTRGIAIRNSRHSRSWPSRRQQSAGRLTPTRRWRSSSRARRSFRVIGKRAESIGREARLPS